jgi:cytochrome c1
VGPQLAGFGRQEKISGTLVNSHDNLVLWIRDPKSVDPLTAMPNMDVTRQDAEDMAAYLIGLK